MESLRMRKKAQTRSLIIMAAEQLITTKGFQATTIADICQMANIAQRTFFAYFPSKEAVFFSDKQSLLDELIFSIDHRAPETTTFQVVRAMLEQRPQRQIADIRHVINYHETLSAESRQLRAYSDSLDQQMEAAFRRGFAHDLDQSADSLGPTLAAAVTSGALHVIFGNQVDADKPQTKHELMDMLDRVLVFLEAGNATLRTSAT